ncbi:MAG: type III pantothenate kinase [Planctomycetota bacterium]|nr:type III pantothenate kinase [Planctomycetota bacterium]
MGERILTIDLGNSRAKLALFEPHAELARAHDFRGETRFETNADLAARISEFLDRNATIRAARLSSVASLAVESEVARVLERRFAKLFVRNPRVLLDVDYAPPEALGRDRLYAARGALDLSDGDAIVVDAGTALTVDVVTANPPRFRGGAIAPGPRLLADALHRHTARLPLVEPNADVPALGRDTRAALQAGVAIGFRGAACELVRAVAEEALLAQDAVVVVTGGAREFLLRPHSCFGERRVIEDALLVHRGLLASLSDSP